MNTFANRYDVSSRFVRYLPDSVIVRTDDNGIGPKTALIEFKVQDTLMYSDHFFNRTIQRTYQNRKRPEDPELTQKSPRYFKLKKMHSIFTSRLRSLGVAVIVIGWQTPTNRLIAQYANKIVICHEWLPDPGKNVIWKWHTYL